MTEISARHARFLPKDGRKLDRLKAARDDARSAYEQANSIYQEDLDNDQARLAMLAARRALTAAGCRYEGAYLVAARNAGFLDGGQ